MEYFLFINLCRKTTGFVILLVLQIVLFSLFLPFSLGTIILPLFFFIVHVVGSGYPVQKSLGGIVWFVVSAIFYAPFPPLWKLLMLALHLMITFWLTGANRKQQLLRFASIITIGLMSILIVQVFHSTYFWFYNGSSRIRRRLCFNAIN